jgi:hypothetical protein
MRSTEGESWKSNSKVDVSRHGRLGCVAGRGDETMASRQPRDQHEPLLAEMSIEGKRTLGTDGPHRGEADTVHQVEVAPPGCGR